MECNMNRIVGNMWNNCVEFSCNCVQSIQICGHKCGIIALKMHTNVNIMGFYSHKCVQNYLYLPHKCDELCGVCWNCGGILTPYLCSSFISRLIQFHFKPTQLPFNVQSKAEPHSMGFAHFVGLSLRWLFNEELCSVIEL